MMRRFVAVFLAFAVVLIGPAVRSAAAATPSTIYVYDAAHDTSDVTSDARLDRAAGEAHHTAPADSAGAVSAASSVFVAADSGGGLLSRIRSIDWADDTGSIGRGTPRTNIAQNKQFNDAIKTAERQLGRTLSKDERSAVHREISGQDYGFHDIVHEVLGMFGGGK